MKTRKTLIFMASVIILLAILCVCFPKDGIQFFGRRLFFPSLEEVFAKDKSMSVSEKMAMLEQSLKIQQTQDSISSAKDKAFQDTVRFYKNFFATHPAKFYLPNNDVTFFNSVFLAMDKCKNDSTIVHILHYGDSQIEEDRITGYLRQKLQEQFGGLGAGLLPLVQPISSAAVGQTATENIERFIIAGMHKNGAGHNRYGALGQIVQVTGGGTVSFSARNYSRTFENTKRWTAVRLFAGRNSGRFQVTLSTKNYSSSKTIDNQSNTPQMLMFQLNDSVKNSTFSFSGNAELTAVSLDGDYGVNVDNIPIRGSSGTFFTQIDSTSMAFVINHLNVKMIMLEFGGNMMPVINERNLHEYMQVLEKQIVYFQKLQPAAKIMLIGPADMSKTVQGKLQTYPILPSVVDSMRDVAVKNGAAFWNMYAVMGGENSMLAWVKERPALAAPDYIHFTPKGADKIAELLYFSLNNYYNYYKILENHKK
ncbi:MAG: hypothetical protein LBT04_02615 [Prevotellaceae bacterium]|jgi:hypothetical protein|nr:hypothetical protein [Prevotellaceae bacterium]